MSSTSGILSVSGLKQSIKPILVGSGLDISQVGTTVTVSTGVTNSAAAPITVTLATDYSVTQLASSSANLVYNSSALFWTTPVITPNYSSSIFYIYKAIQVQVNNPNAGSCGIFVAFFSSNVNGASPLPYGVDGVFSGRSNSTGTGVNAPLIYQSLAAVPATYTNTTGAPFTLYACAYTGISSGASAGGGIIFSSSSTNSPVGGSSASSLSIVEVPT